MVLLVALSLWRVSLRISYEWWRLTHGLFALAVILVGTVHGLQVGHYISGLAKQALWLVAAAIPVGLLFYTRVIRPLRMYRVPWRVVSVRPVSEDVVGLILEPEGHPGMEFQAGQYAWLTTGSTPFTLQQHPFSFASSDEHSGRVEFAIKEAGDFTRTIRDLKPGARAYLEGPYGAFTLDPTAQGAVFVVGGIGIAPALSILRSCRDRREGRPLLLIVANTQWEAIAFGEELDMLSKELDLKIVHVLEQPPDDWNGETGRIDADFLKRHLSEMQGKDFQYFVCGPTPMMDVVDRALVDQGVPAWRLVSERFDLV
jgi:predicted ferric reductase